MTLDEFKKLTGIRKPTNWRERWEVMNHPTPEERKDQEEYLRTITWGALRRGRGRRPRGRAWLAGGYDRILRVARTERQGGEGVTLTEGILQQPDDL